MDQETLNIKSETLRNCISMLYNIINTSPNHQLLLLPPPQQQLRDERMPKERSLASFPSGALHRVAAPGVFADITSHQPSLRMSQNSRANTTAVVRRPTFRSVSS